mgnify:CR=1 FL=1
MSPPNPVLSSPTIRLSVSSTFSDLKAARDALQREVFPQLKQLCLSRCSGFQAIDLRRCPRVRPIRSELERPRRMGPNRAEHSLDPGQA